MEVKTEHGTYYDELSKPIKERKRSMTVRKRSVIELLHTICVEHPVRIDLSKLPELVNSINLSWVIAICKSDFKTFKEVNIDSHSVQFFWRDNNKRFNDFITDPLQYYGSPKACIEYEMTNMIYAEKILQYNLYRDTVINLLSRETFELKI